MAAALSEAPFLSNVVSTHDSGMSPMQLEGCESEAHGEQLEQVVASPGSVVSTNSTGEPIGNPVPISPALNRIGPICDEVLRQAGQVGPVVGGPGSKKEQDAFKLVKLSTAQQDSINRAKKYAMEQSIKTVLVKQTIAHQQQQQINLQTSIQKQQALALMCRIYVGSINFEIKEDTIKQAFQPFGPIKSVNLSWDAVTNKHKGFAFIEYDLPEAAQLAMEQMNNVMIGGRNIKVGRPSNMPQAQPIIEQLREEAKSYNRIYISSVHQDLTELDVQSVFEAFGQVKVCKLVPEPTRPGKHKGYGFMEFASQQAADDAVNSMNLFDLGGQYLRVGKAITPPNLFTVAIGPGSMPTASAVAAAAVTARLTAMEVAGNSSAASNAGIPPVGLAIPKLGSPKLPSVPAPSFVGLGGISGDYLSHPSPVLPPLMVAPLGIAPPLAMPVLPPVYQVAPSAVAAPWPNTPDRLSSFVEEANDAGVMQKMEAQAASIESQENIKISGTQARHMVMQKLMRKVESKVLVLRNMVGVEDCDDMLEGEVTEECSKYGPVNRVIIYQEKQGEEEDAEVLVKIFVEYATDDAVDNAEVALNGRYFAGRVIRAERYPPEMFEAGDLSG